MTDTPQPVPTEDEAAAARRAAAKQRFFAIGILRLSGAFIVIFGLAISMQRFGWVPGDKAKWLGFAISVIGLLQFFIVPRLLARAWATPRDRS